MRLTTYLTRASRDRVALAALEKSCTVRHILEQAVASYIAEQRIDPAAPSVPELPPEERFSRAKVQNCVKITTIISEETRASLKLLKRVRGYSISHSLDRAIHWYLWESPEKMAPRRAFEEAFSTRLDIPDKEPVCLPPGMPSLYDIKRGASVLIDSSIVMLAMDSRRLGYVSPRSAQCEYLILEAKNERIRGFITPLIIAELWQALRLAFQKKGGANPWAFISTRSNSVDDMCRRLQAFCGSAIRTLPVLATDMDTAIALANEAPIDPALALSLAAMHRSVGADFAFATADPERIEAVAAQGGVFAPSDLDQIVPMGEEGSWAPGRKLVVPLSKKPPKPVWPLVEAGSD